eukprot:TRINITY_DN139_c0_g1_i1.p1 TRINITY_DN139_c0_g1~~TRINITY_DN139_c0_g1_i1.p1  ORF type:complete len:203 (-),score=47.82 TRINITY_DN139_c0_g1_i1:217-825(-)
MSYYPGCDMNSDGRVDFVGSIECPEECEQDGCDDGDTPSPVEAPTKKAKKTKRPTAAPTDEHVLEEIMHDCGSGWSTETSDYPYKVVCKGADDVCTDTLPNSLQIVKETGGVRKCHTISPDDKDTPAPESNPGTFTPPTRKKGSTDSGSGGSSKGSTEEKKSGSGKSNDEGSSTNVVVIVVIVLVVVLVLMFGIYLYKKNGG